MKINQSNLGKFIIIGCPRSGTGYASKFFNIGHECVNDNGISSWCLVKSPPSLGPSLEEVQNEFPKVPIYHQIRNPIDTISSFTSMSKKAWDYFDTQLELDPKSSKLKRGMKIYYEWNQLAKSIADFTYRLDEIEVIFPNKAFDNKTYNTREHLKFTESDFINENKELWGKIIKLYEEASNT